MLILGTWGILAKGYMGVKYERIQLSKPSEDKPIFATLSDVFFFAHPTFLEEYSWFACWSSITSRIAPLVIKQGREHDDMNRPFVKNEI